MRPYENDKEFAAAVNYHSTPVGKTNVVLAPKYFRLP